MLLLITMILFVVIQSFNSQTLLTIIGSLAAFVYFIQVQQLQKLRLFKELFQEFNGRYDKLNEGLYQIMREEPNKTLSDNDMVVLFDYFNLCSEEYLYYKRGYIGPDVWKSWKNGMLYLFKNKRIKDAWEIETENNSYYGFEEEIAENL